MTYLKGADAPLDFPPSCLTDCNLNRSLMCSYISLKVKNVEINPCENVKYLGVQMDSKLTFNSHIKMIENKISISIGINIKLKSF